MKSKSMLDMRISGENTGSAVLKGREQAALYNNIPGRVRFSVLSGTYGAGSSLLILSIINTTA